MLLGSQYRRVALSELRWVGNMETRLDRLMRAAEIADAAQQQLLVVEAACAWLGRTSRQFRECSMNHPGKKLAAEFLDVAQETLSGV